MTILKQRCLVFTMNSRQNLGVVNYYRYLFVLVVKKLKFIPSVYNLSKMQVFKTNLKIKF